MMPEMALLFAMLERAICDATGNITPIRDSSKRVLMRRAKNWINSDEQAHFSFIEICAQLEIDPIAIRRYVVACNEPSQNFRGALPLLRRILNKEDEGFTPFEFMQPNFKHKCKTE